MKMEIIVGKEIDMDKLAFIETSIQSALHRIKELEGYLEALYKMRDKQLEEDGIDKDEWIKAVEELKSKCFIEDIVRYMKK